MQTVTFFETSKRLEGAGFPKPLPKRGQIWFFKSGVGMVVTCGGDLLDTEMCDYATASGPLYLNRHLNDGEVFAPTATDILRELPGWHLTYATEIGWHVWWDDGTENDYCEPLLFKHDNPAEAAALAWFHEKEKHL